MKPPSVGKAPAAAARPAKTFSIAQWTHGVEGEKLCIYAETGDGKTTLGCLAPNPVFIAPDDGGRKILHPITGQPMNKVDGVQTFEDVRDALRQANLFPEGCTVVIDTLTKLEALAEPYLFATVKGSKGNTITSMRGYGWDGPGHILDAMRLILSDLDPLVRSGRNVVLLCQQGQVTVANAEGADFIQDGPRLTHNKQYSVRAEVSEWCDHVLKIGYLDSTVEIGEKARVGKVVGTTTRAIYSRGARHFLAKTRPTTSGEPLPPVISFADPTDSSLWQFLFPQETI